MSENLDDAGPDPIDVAVGHRIRVRRKWLGISQSNLADHLGVSFQQVQKYERGANRTSASMLVRIAEKLETTVGDEIDHNIHVGKGTDEDTFVKMREARDATLSMPRLIIPSLQVNMRAGQLPPKDESGKTFLKVPVNGL